MPPANSDSTNWPKDVLMVMHSHMLNPRAFLEDCMRVGHRPLWLAGLPWKLVNAAIDSDFNYNVSDEAKARWIANTGRAWDNAEDPMVKTIKCPCCSAPSDVPWTTCGLSETHKGETYASHQSPRCGLRADLYL